MVIVKVTDIEGGTPGHSAHKIMFCMSLLFLQGALIIINYALKMNEQDAKIHLQKGICLENLKRHPQAIMSFSRAIELDRNYAKVKIKNHSQRRIRRRGDSSTTKSLTNVYPNIIIGLLSTRNV